MKEGIQYQNKVKLIKESCGANSELCSYLLRHINLSMVSLRKICSYTPDDWALYKECREYEHFANRDEEDKAKLSNFGDGVASSWLTEELFNDLKQESDSKKLSYELYLMLSLRDSLLPSEN